MVNKVIIVGYLKSWLLMDDGSMLVVLCNNKEDLKYPLREGYLIELPPTLVKRLDSARRGDRVVIYGKFQASFIQATFNTPAVKADKVEIKKEEQKKR